MSGSGITLTEQKANTRTTNVKGFDMPFKQFDGIDYNFWSTLSENMVEFLEFIRHSDVRDDDVFICTYPRSGTNWTNQIVHMLLSGDPSYVPEGNFLELSDEASHGIMKSPRVFTTHWPFRFLPTQIKETGKVICVLRNPKDVAVSLFNFIRNVKMSDFVGSWDDFLQLYLDGDLPGGSWFSYVKDWENVIESNPAGSILTMYYEQMQIDQLKAIEQIAEFLGVPAHRAYFSKIAKKCDFKEVKKEKLKHIPEFESSFGKDPKEHFLYRKGVVGDWRNWFTVSQNEEFNIVYQNEMRDSKLALKFIL